MAEPASKLTDRITVWACPVCGYWRDKKSTGVHQTFNPDDPNGRMVVHDLEPVTYALEKARGVMRTGLTRSEWDALVEAERVLYGAGYGSHAYTVFHRFDEAHPRALVASWSLAEDVESDNTAEVARRVARALAVLAFGEDFRC